MSSETGDGATHMVFLSRKRKELSALHEIAAICEAQNQLRQNVQTRMQQINSLLDDDKHGSRQTVSNPPSFASDTEEEAYWKTRVAELSIPTPRLEGVQQGNATAVTRDLREKARCRQEALTRTNDTANGTAATQPQEPAGIITPTLVHKRK